MARGLSGLPFERGRVLSSPNFLLIDDHGLFSSGVELIIRQSFPGARFASFAALGTALEWNGAIPDVVLLDINLQGISGIEAVPMLRLRWPGCRIVFVTSEQDQTVLARAMASGVEALVAKSESPERLVSVLRRQVHGIQHEPTGSPDFSPRQVEVLKLLSEGQSNKAIGRTLGLSEFTVRGHVQLILKSLGVTNRTAAVFRAREVGLL